jgi:hypothetical protein
MSSRKKTCPFSSATAVAYKIRTGIVRVRFTCCPFPAANAVATRSFFHPALFRNTHTASAFGSSTRIHPWLKSRRVLPKRACSEVECRYTLLSFGKMNLTSPSAFFGPASASTSIFQRAIAPIRHRLFHRRRLFVRSTSRLRSRSSARTSDLWQFSGSFRSEEYWVARPNKARTAATSYPLQARAFASASPFPQRLK